MNRDERGVQIPTRASLRPLIESLRGEPIPSQVIIDSISQRVTGGMTDEANAMRIDLYLIDIMRVAEAAGEKTDEELIEEVKRTDGFSGIELSSIRVSDETTLSFLREMRQGLVELASRNS